MNAQARDLVCAMAEAKSVPDECALCGQDLVTAGNVANVYSPFATVCRPCADECECAHDLH